MLTSWTRTQKWRVKYTFDARVLLLDVVILGASELVPASWLQQHHKSMASLHSWLQRSRAAWSRLARADAAGKSEGQRWQKAWNSRVICTPRSWASMSMSCLGNNPRFVALGKELRISSIVRQYHSRHSITCRSEMYQTAVSGVYFKWLNGTGESKRAPWS